MVELNELPAPRRGAKASYYPDPLGSGRARWWDGAKWTHMLGPLVAPDAVKGKPVPPPTKVCRHCGAQSETFESSCPSCGRAYSLNRGAIIAIVAVAVGATVLFLGGCAALIVVGVNEVEEERDEHEITREQYESIQPGATRASVEARLGEPFERDRFNQPAGGICLYYPEDGEDLFSDYFEFCFVGGRLDSKHAP
ncbi:MAG: DUF2510 domain-containing protein [Solirubrobacterales bacterium]